MIGIAGDVGRVAAATGQLVWPAVPVCVNCGLSGVPSVSVTVDPLWAIVELEKTTVFPAWM